MHKDLDCKILRSLVNNLNVSINVFDIECRRIFVNSYYYYLSGRKKGSIFSEDMTVNENVKKGEYIAKKVSDAIRLGKNFEIKNFYYKSRGKKTRRYFDFFIGPLKDNEGKIIGAYSMVKDVTTRFLARKKLLNINNVLEKKIKERTEKLEKVSKEKSMLISDIAHEIKTLLTIIKGNLEICNIKNRDCDLMEIECFGEINRELDVMNRMVSDLVFISKSHEYIEIFKFEKINLIDIIRSLTKKYKAIAEERNLKIINNSRIRKPLLVTADKIKISTMIGNLVDNAIKFSRENCVVSISAQKKNSMAYIKIKDDGIGIEKEKINYIFSPFYQADKTNNFKKDRKIQRGFGLGLAICKKIIEAHNGNIRVQSDGLGKGTTFEVFLPLKNKIQKKRQKELFDNL